MTKKKKSKPPIEMKSAKKKKKDSLDKAVEYPDTQRICTICLREVDLVKEKWAYDIDGAFICKDC